MRFDEQEVIWGDQNEPKDWVGEDSGSEEKPQSGASGWEGGVRASSDGVRNGESPDRA